MVRVRGYRHVLVVIVLTALVAGGCASVAPKLPPVAKPVAPEAEGARKGWWKVVFRINWPENTEPSWHMDLFLSHVVISPVLDLYRKNIDLWRFHRRAARDQAGHQFSFIFYSSLEAAQQIYSTIKSDINLQEMKTAGLIVRDVYDDTAETHKTDIGDTSDSRWSPPIKKSWPYFIMGVSRMWLNLITEIAERTSKGKRPSSVEEIQAFYQQVNQSITESWQEEGRHALLHHLNAIFGYEPLVVYEKRFVTF